MVQLELDFRLALEPGYLAVALPKFNVMAINELLCLFRGFYIVGAFVELDPFTVVSDPFGGYWALIKREPAP